MLSGALCCATVQHLTERDSEKIAEAIVRGGATTADVADVVPGQLHATQRVKRCLCPR